MNYWPRNKQLVEYHFSGFIKEFIGLECTLSVYVNKFKRSKVNCCNNYDNTGRTLRSKGE